jgi:hypothetical protein
MYRDMYISTFTDTCTSVHIQVCVHQYIYRYVYISTYTGMCTSVHVQKHVLNPVVTTEKVKVDFFWLNVS